jgi:hypothetical protein
LVGIGNLAHTHFYQVEVRRYAPGTRVETFAPRDLQTYRETIEETTAALMDPDASLTLSSPRDPLPVMLTLEP